MKQNMAITKHLKVLFVLFIFTFGLYMFLVYRYNYGVRYTLSRGGLWETFYFSEDANNSNVVLPLDPETHISTTEKVLVDKRILFWTSPKCWDCAPFSAFKYGNLIFKQNNCEYQNCYITPNYRNLSEIDPENYDAVMFNGRPTLRMTLDELPKKRREEQVYIFVQLEAAVRFPMCQSYFDDFFNWTITYRLDSDIPWTYFEVKTKENVTIGPNMEIKWVHDGDWKISDILDGLVSNKSELAAWFVSNCNHGDSNRMTLVNTLNEELQRIDEDTSVHIFGQCGKYKCYRNESERCNKLIEQNYMFYMALENSFDEDYITEKVMKALEHYAVPVVFSGVDYNRFLPPGSYLDAVKLGPQKLAKKMIQLYIDREEYAKYFQWRSAYTFSDNFSHADVACKICERLNTDKDITRHLNFRKWWKKDFIKHCT